MVSTKSKIIKWLGYVTVVSFVVFSLWRLTALFYGGLSFTFSKYFLIMAAFCGVFQFILAAVTRSMTWREIATLVLMALIALAVLIQISALPDIVDWQGRSAHSFLLAFTGFNFFWLFVGYGLQVIGRVPQCKWIALVLLLTVAILIIGVLHGDLVINYRDFEINMPGGERATHLTVGPSTFLLLIWVYALASGWVRMFAFIVTLPILFAIGGRADLVIYPIAVIAYEFLNKVSLPKLAVAMLILILGALVIVNLPFSVLDFGGVPRMIFADGIEPDSSYIARNIVLRSSLQELPKQAPVGDVSSIVVLFGSVGSFMHNLLSVWQFYGVVVFLLLVVLLISNIRRIRQLGADSTNALGVFGILVFVSACVGVIIAKSFVYPTLWVALGYCTGNFPSVGHNELRAFADTPTEKKYQQCEAKASR